MSMYTRCSSCNTHFRVTVQQLQACSGQVRCGRCTTVFDAFATLTARPPGREDEPPSLDTSIRSVREAPEAAASALPSPAVAGADIESQAATALAVAVRPVAAPAAAQVYASSAEEAMAVLAGTSERIALGPDMAMASPTPAEPLTLPENLFSSHGKRSLPGPQWLWRTGLGGLVTLALIQSLFLFRAELAAAMPGTRPLLSAMCRPVRCEVPLPRYPDSLFIESSDLQMVDSAKPEEVLLSATLRNRAQQLQAYPAIELTLTDTMDRAVAKRVFLPTEYLPSHLQEERGFAAGSEVSVRIMLNTSDLRAAGYRLFLYFPT